MADEFTMGTGQAHELAMAFSRNGWNNADVKKLSEGDRLAKILQFIRGQAEISVTKFPSLIHAADLIPTGWEIAIINGVPQDVEPTQFDITKLKARSFLREGDGGRISGEEMRKRAVPLGGNLGLSDAKRLLDDGGKLIPVAFRDFYIPLPGTLLRDPYGDLDVPYLSWYDDRWCLSFFWLGSGWNVSDRLACSEPARNA